MPLLPVRFYPPPLPEKLVENTIREIKPQVVMVELDAQRVGGFLEESMKVRLAVPDVAFFCCFACSRNAFEL